MNIKTSQKIDKIISHINKNPKLYNKKNATITSIIEYSKKYKELQKVSYYSVKEYLHLFKKKDFIFVIQPTGIKDKTLKAINDLIKYINKNPNLYDKKNASFLSLEKLIKECDDITNKLSIDSIKEHRELFIEKSFYFPMGVQKRKKHSILAIKEAIKYINKNPKLYNKKEATYISLEIFIEKCEGLPNKVKADALNSHSIILTDKGFIFVGVVSNIGKKEETLTAINETIKYIDKNPKSYNKVGASALTLERFIKECDGLPKKISKSSIERNKNIFKEAGFIFSNAQVLKTISAIKEAIKYINKNPKLYNKKKANYRTIASFIKGCDALPQKFSLSTIKNYKELFTDGGFTFYLTEKNSVIHRLEEAVKYIKKNPKVYNIKQATYSSLAKFIDGCDSLVEKIDKGQIQKYKEICIDEGFIFCPNGTKEKIEKRSQAIKELVEYINKNPESYNIKEASFASLAKFIDSCDALANKISLSVLKRNRKNLSDNGFDFRVEQSKESDTQHLATNTFRKHFKEENIYFNSEVAFQELCRDFYNSSIKLHIISGNFASNHYPQIIELDSNKLISLVEHGVDKLTSEQDNFTIMQLKTLFLFENKIYIDVNTISNILAGLELLELVKPFQGLQERFNLAILILEHNKSGVIFTKNLPKINNSDTIVLDSKLKNKKYFMISWLQYCEFIIEHRMESYTGKLAIKDKATKLEDLRETQKDGLLLNKWQQDLFEEYGIELLTAMTLYPKKMYDETKILNQHKGIIQKILGYFTWLYYQNLALLTPRIIKTDKTRNHQSTQNKLLLYFLEKNAAFNLHTGDLSSSDITHLYSFCHSIRNDFSAKELTQDDFDIYLERCGHYARSGNKRHSVFMHQYMKYINNFQIRRNEEPESISEQFNRYALTLSNVCIENYKNFIRLTLLHLEKIEISDKYKIEQIKNVVFLLEYINAIHNGKILSKKEMSIALNPQDREDNYIGIREWAISINSTKKRDTVYQETTVRALFLDIFEDEDNPYYGIYSEKWKNINALYESSTNSYNRNMYVERIAHDRTTSAECARVCLYNPPFSTYPLRKTTSNGDPVNLDWWKHETSPVPAFLIFIGISIPLRWIQVRHLDLNTFFRTVNGDIDGDFDGFYINTDKNTNRSKPYIISATIIRKLLKTEEIEAIRSFIKYMRECYGDKPTCAHENQSKRYPNIQALFPHHEISVNRVYDKAWLEGFLSKVMCSASINIRANAKGIVSENLGISINDVRHDNLIKKYKNLQLVTSKQADNIPASKAEVNNFSDIGFKNLFKLIGGSHSWRHTGITNLAKIGWPSSIIMQITGHASILTILQVYERLDAESLLSIFDAKNFDIEKLIDMNPLEAGFEMVNTIKKRLVTFDKAVVVELLKEVEFVGTSGHISSNYKELFGDIGLIEIDDPIDFAANYDPLHEWKILNEGICPVGCNCPGKSMACGNCPLLISSPIHISTIVQKLNMFGLLLADNNNIILQLRTNKTSSASHRLEEIEALQMEYLDEYIGWIDKLETLRKHIQTLLNNSEKNLVTPNNNSSLKVNNILQFVNQLPIDEAYLNVLSEAYQKHLEGLDTEAIKNRAFALMVTSKLNNGAVDVNDLNMRFLEGLIREIGLSENKQEKISQICNKHFRISESKQLKGKQNLIDWKFSNTIFN